MSTITRIEDFSNEIFYEIFDYLYGNDIYKAFSILNYRFDQLLHCPFLQYKIQIDDSCIEGNTMDELKQISHRIKIQILSMKKSDSQKKGTNSFRKHSKRRKMLIIGKKNVSN